MIRDEGSPRERGEDKRPSGVEGEETNGGQKRMENFGIFLDRKSVV